MMKKIFLTPIIILAWAFHFTSEKFYQIANYLYMKCGTNIFEANIKWEK